jgi:hypothetical protein
VSLMNDLTGWIFGRLTALRCVGRNKSRGAVWLCVCSCDGKEIPVASHNLVTGHTVSCGCFRREDAAARHWKHGHASRTEQSPTYRSWESMITRCTNSNFKQWQDYGGAGITVCERWRTFEFFLEDMGERPANTSIGRFGDVGNYEKSNCAWQNPKQQGLERKIKHWNQKLAALAA